MASLYWDGAQKRIYLTICTIQLPYLESVRVTWKFICIGKTNKIIGQDYWPIDLDVNSEMNSFVLVIFLTKDIRCRNLVTYKLTLIPTYANIPIKRGVDCHFFIHHFLVQDALTTCIILISWYTAILKPWPPFCLILPIVGVFQFFKCRARSYKGPEISHHCTSTALELLHHQQAQCWL